MHKRMQAGWSVAVVAALALGAGACGAKNESGSPNPEVVPVTAFSKPVTTVGGGGTSTTAPADGGDPTTTVKRSTVGPAVTTATLPKTTTTEAPKGPAFAAAAVAAYRAKLGEFKALELVVHVDNGNATLQAQDPGTPANVDEYDYDGTSIDGPSPVKLTGDGKLEDNLFAVGEVAWDKIPAMMQQAVTTIGPLEGSTGVTHLIVQKNLPFDTDTVVDVYVDGGTRSDGGYVSFKADGTLKKAYPPS
jgi:hypothetical protein